MKAVRGAIAPVENNRDAIRTAGLELFQQVCKSNSLSAEDITMLLFTCTSDLNASYPAEGVRLAGYDNVAMLCLQEMDVIGALKGCIRIMVLTSKPNIVTHTYIGEAKKLRPDWVGDNIGR